MYKIEKNIKMPKKRWTYPFKDMEIGDSFFVGCEMYERKKKQTLICVSANFQSKKTGKKFNTRAVEGGVRCWRVE